MPKGGPRPGSGRPKGGLNRLSHDIAMAVARDGISPVEVMIRAMRLAWEAGDIPTAVEYACKAAPYTSPRVMHIEMTAHHEINPREVSDAELARIATSGGGGRIIDAAEDSGIVH